MDELLKYYEYLKSKHADVPDTFESFHNTLRDDISAKKYYEYLRDNDFDAPDSFESFQKTFDLKKKSLPLGPGVAGPPEQGVLSPESFEPSPAGAQPSQTESQVNTPGGDLGKILVNAPEQTPVEGSVPGIVIPDFNKENLTRPGPLGQLLPPPQVNENGMTKDEEMRLRQNLGIDEKPMSLMEHAGSMAGAFNKSVVDMATSIPKGGAIIRRFMDQAIHGDSKPLQAYDLYKLGTWIDKKALDLGLTATDKRTEGDFWEQTVPSALGSAMAFMLTGVGSEAVGNELVMNAPKGALGKATQELGQLLTSRTAAFGGNLQGIQEFESAKQSGATDQQAFEVYVKNYGVGMTEVVPLARAMERINKFTGGKIVEVLKAGTIGAFEEGTQEGVQQYLSNKIAAGTYDPSREPWDDLIQNIGAGAFVGFVLPGIGAAMQSMSPEQREGTKAAIRQALLNNQAQQKPEEAVNAPEGDRGKDKKVVPEETKKESQSPEGKAGETPKPENRGQEKGRQEEVLGTPKAKTTEKEPESPSLENAISKFDQGENDDGSYYGIDDLVGDLNEISQDHPKGREIRDAIAKYEEEARYDQEELGMRGDSDQYEGDLISTIKGIINNGKPEPTPAPSPKTRAETKSEPISVPKDLKERGEQVANILDAKRRFDAGERIFAFHDMEGEPTSEIKNVGELDKYTHDQLLAYPEEKYVPKDGWENHLIKAREYAQHLGIDFKGKGLEQLVSEIQDKIQPKEGKQNAIQKSSSSSVLQHPQEGIGEKGSERGGVESGKQGQEITQETPVQKEPEQVQKPEEKPKVEAPFFKEIEVTPVRAQKRPNWEKMTPEEHLADISERVKTKKKDIDTKVKDLLDLIGEGGLGAVSDPKADAERQYKITMKAGELLGDYLELGVLRFQEIAQHIYQTYGEPALRALFPHLKAKYLAIQGDREDITGMDDIGTVRGIKAEDIIKSVDNGRDTTVPDNTRGNAPEIPGGKTTEETGGPVSEGQVGGIPQPNSGQGGRQPGGSQEAGTLKQVQAEVADLEEKMKTEEIPDDEDPERKRDDFEGEQDLSMASTGQGPTDPPLGTSRKNKKGRIPVSPILGSEAKPLRNIMVDLSKTIDSKIWYSKKPGRRKALGLYVPRSGSMIIKYTDDLDTTAHELGHSMDDKFDLLGKVTDTKVEKELMKLSKYGSSPPKGHPDPHAYKLNEGIAEFIRAWLVNPQVTEIRFPEFTLVFQATVPADVRSQLRDFGDDIRRYAGQPAIQMIQSKVKWEPERGEGLWKRLFPSSKANFELTIFDRFTKSWLNQLRPFEKAVAWMIEKQGLTDFAKNKPSDDPRILARLLFGTNSKIQDILKHGFIDNENPVDKDGAINRRLDPVTNEPMSLEWLLSPYDNTDVTSLEKDMKDAMAVAIARRTIELASKLKREDYIIGVGAGIFTDVKIADQALQDFELMEPERKQRIEEGLRRYKAYADASLDIAVESGRASQEWADRVREANLEYVALGRIADAGPGEELVIPRTGGQGSKTLGAISDLVKRIKGSTKTIQNPYKTLMENTIRIVKEADRNRVLLEFRNLLTNVRGMNEGDVAYLGSIGTQVGSGDNQNTQVIFVDGKREYWKLDADVYKFIKGMGEQVVLPGWMTALPRLLRWGVIHFPVFALRNRLRDIQQRLVVAKHGWSGVELNLKPKLRHSVKQAYEQFGGGQSGHWLLNEDAFNAMMDKTMLDLAKDKRNILVDPRRLFREGGDLYDRVIQSGETATRLEEYRGAYREAIAKGMDPYNASVYAAFKARDLMDFAVAGEIMNVVNQLVPFSNAAVQGLRKTIRSAKEDPGGFAVRFMLYSLIPSIMMRMLAHWMDRDDEYANLPDYRRDLFYNIPVGDNLWLVIPKSFEIGVLGSAGDRLAGKYFYGEKKAFDGYAGSVARSISPMDEAALAGPARSAIEVTANYDFFRGQHLIPTEEEGLDLSLRDTSKATRLGQALSATFGMDPRYWDHIVRSNAGYFGDFALRLSDIAKENSRHKLIDWTTTGVFRNDPVYDSKAVQDMMTKMKQWGMTSRNVPKDLKSSMALFNLELSTYFEAKDPTEKHEAGKRVRDVAEYISETIDILSLPEIQVIKHEEKMIKRGK